MNKVVLILVSFIVLGAVGFQFVTNKKPPAKHTSEIGGIAPDIKPARTWKPGEIKLDLNKPEIIGEMRKNGNPVKIYIWSKNQNDFNVPVAKMENDDIIFELPPEQYETFKQLFSDEN